jgi:hypothetical protein
MKPSGARDVGIDGWVHIRPTTGYSEAAMQRTIQLSETEARQGVTLGRMRYVLGISMALAVLAMVLAFSAT